MTDQRRVHLQVSSLLLLACLLAALLPAAGAAAPALNATEKPLTAADVRRIALASAPGANARTGATTAGLQQARVAGVPVNLEYLADHPEVGSQVPLAAPSEAGKADKYISAFKGAGAGPVMTRESSALPWSELRTLYGLQLTRHLSHCKSQLKRGQLSLDCWLAA